MPCATPGALDFLYFLPLELSSVSQNSYTKYIQQHDSQITEVLDEVSRRRKITITEAFIIINRVNHTNIELNFQPKSKFQIAKVGLLKRKRGVKSRLYVVNSQSPLSSF